MKLTEENIIESIIECIHNHIIKFGDEPQKIYIHQKWIEPIHKKCLVPYFVEGRIRIMGVEIFEMFDSEQQICCVHKDSVNKFGLK